MVLKWISASVLIRRAPVLFRANIHLMLCQFTFRNFKSFKNEAFLDFYAENISEMKETLIKGKNDDEFLPVISLYGPNGGGKSTVLEALIYLRNFVLYPLRVANPSSISEAGFYELKKM